MSVMGVQEFCDECLVKCKKLGVRHFSRLRSGPPPLLRSYSFITNSFITNAFITNAFITNDQCAPSPRQNP